VNATFLNIGQNLLRGTILDASSQTAVLVCMARAAANGATPVAAFSDPTALALLPAEARTSVERHRAKVPPKDRRERMQRVFLEKRAQMMVVRTVAIDDAVRAAPSPQVVILGAGLDGRAWRMPELGNSVVFEVDHPDTQREKTARVQELTQKAAEVRATTWIWEGVVMYLTRADAEATLAVVERRSPPASRLVIAYISPAPMRWVAALFLRRLGEPIRSVFTADAMRELLGRFGFGVVEDEDVCTIGRALSPELGKGTETRPMRHLRIVTADRRSSVETHR
jgi:O-methyltransferase involved in polyketide biosynthesis